LITDASNQFIHKNTSSQILSYLRNRTFCMRAVLRKTFCTELRETVVSRSTSIFSYPKYAIFQPG
ncbi:MAG TPA: hypothetical protein VGD69_07730, partial [Herpetosiphonaceae bacterium]